MAFAAAALILCSVAPDARAEKVGQSLVTTEATSLKRQPRPRARTAAKVPKGTTVVVLAVRKKWVRVKSGKARGWLRRASVEPLKTVAESTGMLEHLDRSSRTTIETVLHSGPGESKKAVAKLKSGTTIRVLAKKGRWLRVRAGKKVGWIPRTTATLTDQVATAEPEKSPERADAASWRKQGSIGVGGQSKTTRKGSDEAIGAQPTVVAEPEPTTEPISERPMRKVWAMTRARLGVTSLGMTFRSNGNTSLSDYKVAADAFSTGLSGEAAMRVLGSVLVAADLGYVVSFGLPGIRYQAADDGADPVGFDRHEVDVGARLGYSFGAARPVSVFARAGYHFTWMGIDDVQNIGLLAREGLGGATAGLHVEALVDSQLVARAGADMLVGGNRKQTPGLEDGESSRASAILAKAMLTYFLRESLVLEGAYHLAWASTEWDGASMRQPTITSASRDDRSHTFLFGVGKLF